MNVKKVKLEDLNFDPRNTRVHDTRNIETIKESLLKFGQYRAFVVQREGMVVRVGNGMLRAMLELEWSEGFAELKDLTDGEAAALSIIDNRSAELAEWDEYLLADIFKSLPEELLKITGFAEEEIKKNFSNIESLKKIEEWDLSEVEMQPAWIVIRTNCLNLPFLRMEIEKHKDKINQMEYSQ